MRGHELLCLQLQDLDLTMDLEEYRQSKGWTYNKLAKAFGWSSARTAQRYALGINFPSPLRMEAIIKRSEGRVGVMKMHQRHIEYLRRHGALADIGVDSVDWPPVTAE